MVWSHLLYYYRLKEHVVYYKYLVSFLYFQNVYHFVYYLFSKSPLWFTIHKKAISEGDIQKLYTSGVFGLEDPVSLHNKVFWDIMLNFACRGQEGLDILTRQSYGKFQDNKGHSFYKMMYNESNKTHHGVDSRENYQETRMYANLLILITVRSEV